MPKQATKNLGQVDFADSRQAPVFEPDSEERLEEMATSSRGPLRFAASAFLRVDARAARLRRDPPEVVRPAAGPAHNDVHRPGRSSRPPAAPRLQGTLTRPDAPAAPAAPTTPIARPARPARKPAGAKTKRPTKAKTVPFDEVAWRTWSAGTEDNGLAHALAELDQDRRPAGRSIVTLRRRMGQALDHWAEREAELGLRLDRALFRSAREP